MPSTQMDPASGVRLSSRLNVIKPSASMMAKRKVDTLREQGRNVVDFTIGEPDLHTPSHIAEAGITAIREGRAKYTSSNGISPLLEAVRQKYRQENGLEFAREQIIVGAGAKQLIFVALQATLDEGDEVIIPTPYWVSYPDMVRLNGGVPVVVESDGANGFVLDAERLERAITPRTRWLLLNAPNNPCGSMYSLSAMTALLDVLERHPHVMLMVDEIYEHFSYGERYISPLNLRPGLTPRTLLVNGVSKAYAMTGWRLGYAAGPAELIKAMSMLVSQTTSCVSEISQHAAVAALTGDQQCVRDTVELYRARRDTMVSLLNPIPGMRCPAPDGAFYVFADIRQLLGRTTPSNDRLRTDVDFVHYLLDRTGVAVLDGTAYGVPGHIRMSFATDMDTIREGCRLIAQACAELS